MIRYVIEQGDGQTRRTGDTDRKLFKKKRLQNNVLGRGIQVSTIKSINKKYEEK